jgi:hypothetical protein
MFFFYVRRSILRQSFLAGFGASGALTSALRFTTKAAFESTRGGFRKGASKCRSPIVIAIQGCLRRVSGPSLTEAIFVVVVGPPACPFALRPCLRRSAVPRRVMHL